MIIRCRECGRPTSSEASQCPACGATVRTKPWWIVGLILIVPMAMIGIAVVGMLAAIAIPSFVRARTVSQHRACQANLLRIEAAQQMWATDAHGLKKGEVWDEDGPLTTPAGERISVTALERYMPGLESLACPAGGRYTMTVHPPRCSVAGHGVGPWEP